MYEEHDDVAVSLEDLLEDGRFDDAQEVLALLAADQPDNAALRSLRAFCLVELKQEDEALAEARAAVAIDPHSAFGHWTLGVLLCDRRQLKEAMTAATRAVQLDQADARYHALIAQIHALRGEWQETRKTAERGLQLNPDDEVCSSLRALALRGSESPEQWSAAVDELVHRYPASGWARAGRGWRLLEVGEAAAARQSFEQALALDPTSEFARSGLIESMKATSSIYAALLRLFLWLDRMPPRTRWTYILGGLFAFRLFRRITAANPALGVVTYPLMAAWVLFILASWTAEPLSDFILSRTTEGRRLVSGDRLLAGQLVVGTIAAAAVAALAWAVTGSERAAGATMGLAFLVLPVAGVFRCPAGWPRNAMALYATIASAACVAIIAAPPQLSRVALVTVVLMSVVGTWLGTYLGSRVPAR